MTNAELKDALMNESPVVWRSPVYGEIRYKCVHAIRYMRGKNGSINILAELMDHNNNSITTVNVREVFFDDEEEN